jgi:ribonuclease P protein component
VCSEDAWKGVRIGLIIPRFKHSAVARNRLKRRLRELTRIQILPTTLAVDLVLRIRPEAYNASFDVLSKDIVRVLEQLGQWCVIVDGTVPIEQTGTNKPVGTE